MEHFSLLFLLLVLLFSKCDANRTHRHIANGSARKKTRWRKNLKLEPSTNFVVGMRFKNTKNEPKTQIVQINPSIKKDKRLHFVKNFRDADRETKQKK